MTNNTSHQKFIGDYNDEAHGRLVKAISLVRMRGQNPNQKVRLKESVVKDLAAQNRHERRSSGAAFWIIAFFGGSLFYLIIQSIFQASGVRFVDLGALGAFTSVAIFYWLGIYLMRLWLNFISRRIEGNAAFWWLAWSSPILFFVGFFVVMIVLSMVFTGR